MSTEPPLIITAGFEPEAQAYFEAARRRHFPPERNLIPAHLTLFHHLPGDRLGDVLAAARDAVATHAEPLPARCTAVRSLGRGGAFVIEAPGLAGIRQHIAAAFRSELTPQDAQRSTKKPGWHVTFQNKVDRETAARTLETVRAAFEPFETTIIALELWYYLGGPWSHAATLPIGSSGT